MKRKDVVGIVAFGFGVPSTIYSNCCIAQIASQKARELNVPVYTQLDVRVERGIEVKYINEELGNPPPTLRIARGAVQWAKKRGLKVLLIVAAQPHLWRCERDLIRAIKEAGAQIAVRVCFKEIKRYPEDSWYCPDSTQPRTRSPKSWWGRERILQLMPFFFYKLVAS